MVGESDLNKVDKTVLATVLNMPAFKSVMEEMSGHVKSTSGQIKASGKDIVTAYQNTLYIESHYADEMLKLSGIIEKLIPNVRDQANAMNKLQDVAKAGLQGYLKDAANAEAASRRLETARTIWGGIAEAASAAGIQLKFTIGTLVSGIMAVSEATAESRKRQYAVAPSGVFGLRPTAYTEGSTYKTTQDMIDLGVKSKEVSGLFAEVGRAGMRTGKAFNDLEQRVEYSQAAQQIFNMTKDTSDAFYRNINVKLGKGAEDGARVLGLFAQRSESTGVSMEMYGQIFNSLTSSSGAFGSKLEDLTLLSTMYGKSIQEGRISMGDLVKIVSSLKEAPMGQQIGQTMLARQFGTYIPSALQGKSPLEIPGIIARREVSGSELMRMQMGIVEEQARRMPGGVKGFGGIMAAQKMWGVSEEAASTIMGKVGTADTEKVAKIIEQAMGQQDPKKQIDYAMRTADATSGMWTDIRRYGDRLLTWSSYNPASGPFNLSGKASPGLPSISDMAHMGLPVNININIDGNTRTHRSTDADILYNKVMDIVEKENAVGK